MGTTVKEIMSKNPLKIVEGTSIEEALRILVNHRITGLPVVDRRERMIGVLSEYDILLQVAKAKRIDVDIFSQPVRFSRKLLVVQETAALQDVMKLFVKTRVRRLPVVDRGKKLVGIVTRRDLMRVFYYRSKLAAEEIL